jgi:hypothetical protein
LTPSAGLAVCAETRDHGAIAAPDIALAAANGAAALRKSRRDNFVITSSGNGLRRLDRQV